MHGPKFFLSDLKLRIQNSNQDPSFVSVTHTCVFICPQENYYQIIIPNMIQFCFIQLQIHKFSWMETCPNVSIPLIQLYILDNRI